ncbi:MAG: HEAT repeat domain-containing protein [Planctomycetota bacterium]|nr:HEAT repeat domain-containing protein [Planctomycetota bacterium]
MLRSLLLLLLVTSSVHADEVELKNGNVLQGKVTDLGDTIRLTRNGSSMVIPKSQIREIRPGKTDEEIYQEKAEALSKDDLEGHLTLARWCTERHLKKQAEKAFQTILDIDPDHKEARTALGYQKINGEWKTFEEIQKDKGLILFRGKWVLPSERALQLALEKQKSLAKQLAKEVRKWLGRVGFQSEKIRKEAIDKLATIDDQYKSAAYIKALTATRKEKRLFVIRELHRMKEKEAAKGLARRVVWDKDPKIRSEALSALLSIQNPNTPLFLAAWLKEDSIYARIRAEEAVGKFSDLRPMPALITLLSRVTKTIQWIDQYRDQMTKTLRGTLLLRDGRRIQIPPDMLLSMDGFDPHDREKLLLERDTLIASLRAITGEDFGEDISRWNNWYRKNKK